MHWWTILWDWNTLESVRRVHSFFEGWALVFFALLVISDVLAHFLEDKYRERAKSFERIGLCFFGIAVLAEALAWPYGQRNDELSGAQDKEQKARIAALDLARVKLEALFGPRKLTPENRAQLVTRLAKLAGTDVDLFVFGGNEWTRFEALQFGSILESAIGKEGAGLNTRSYFGDCDLRPVIGVGVIGFADGTPTEQAASATITRELGLAGVDISMSAAIQAPICPLYFGDPKQKPRTKPGWAKIRIVIGIKPDPMIGRPTFRDFNHPKKP